MKIKSMLVALVAALSVGLAACEFNGGVEQGRCVAYEPNKTVTLVEDTSLDQHNPHYSGKVFTYKIPTDARDMGPAPEAGDLLQLDPEKGNLLWFDPSTGTVQTMEVKYTNVLKNVTPRSAQVKGKTFPIIDKENRTITVYSPRLEELVTFQVNEDQINLPENTWKAGDEVRVAYRRDMKDQAIRIMNVSKTSIFTR